MLAPPRTVVTCPNCHHHHSSSSSAISLIVSPPLRSFLTLTTRPLAPLTPKRRATTCTTARSPTSTPTPISGNEEVEEEHQEDRFQTVELETAGAYRLVDRRTGRNVIVWGQPPSFPLPLPPSPKGQDGPQIEKGLGVGGGFAKLKTQKVRSLIIGKTKRMMSLSSSSQPQSQSQSQSPSPSPSPSPIQVHSQVKQPKRTLVSHDSVTGIANHDDIDTDSDDSPTINARSHLSTSNSLRGWGGVSSSGVCLM